MWKSGHRIREHSRRLNEHDATISYCSAADRGQMQNVTIQYVPSIDNDFRSAVRYDTAHGQPHQDILDWSGETVAKEWLPAEMTLNDAMTYSERDILEHWPSTAKRSCGDDHERRNYPV